MNCASQAVTMLSANSFTVASSPTNTTSFVFLKRCHHMDSVRKQSLSLFRTRASSADEPADCNVEECAPEKEVGKVSMEWLAGEKTKISGTFPPRNRGWTGYIEKDTAGQTNIYSIEPAVYVAETGISSGTAGSSSDGAENTKAIAGGFALIAIAAASSILLQVGKNADLRPQAVEYSGPSLSYYINKFQPEEIIQASIPSQPETSTSIEQPASSDSPVVDAPAPSSSDSEEAKET